MREYVEPSPMPTFYMLLTSNLAEIKEGVLLKKNVSAAPIGDQFTVVAPGCWIKEPVPFLTTIQSLRGVK